jgi:hypothetical protein
VRKNRREKQITMPNILLELSYEALLRIAADDLEVVDDEK